MVQKVKMHALDVNGQYTLVHPETSADQVVDMASGQTISNKIADGTFGVVNHKETKRPYIITATSAGQTIFPFNETGLDLTSTSVTVHLNGEFLHQVDEYSVNTTGITPQVILHSGVLVGDVVHVLVERGMSTTDSQSLTHVLGDISNVDVNIIDTLNTTKRRSETAKQAVVQSLLVADNKLPITMDSSWSDIIAQTGNIQSGIDINGVIEQYQVEAGASISAGDFVEFINRMGISLGTPVVFESAYTIYISAVALSETKVLVSYHDAGNSGYGTAIVLTINGSSISLGTPVVFESANTYYISAVVLSETKVLVSYSDSGNNYYGTAIVLTINGSSISLGTPVVFESASTTYISAVALSETKVLVSYMDAGYSIYGTAIVLTIDGSSITVGTPVVFESATTQFISPVSLSETKVLVSYYDGGNSSYGTAIVLTINGSSITVGTPVVFSSANTQFISAVALSETKVLVSYMDAGNSNYGTAIVLTINGSSITVGTPVIFRISNTQYISAVALSETKVLVSYMNAGNNNYGTAIVLNIEGSTIKKSTSRSTIQGVAQQSGSASQTIPVITL